MQREKAGVFWPALYMVVVIAVGMSMTYKWPKAFYPAAIAQTQR